MYIVAKVVGGYLRGEGKNPVRINAIYDGNPGSIWSTAQNTSLVVNYFGVNGLGYLPASPAELGGWSGGTAQDVINAVNSGAYILQHRDHGYEPGWGEPDFTTANIPSLNNVGKMTYVFSINCLTGKFNHSSKCFQEVFHLHQWQGQNAGAVGVLCPTSTSFSFVNDTYIWGVYDLFDPDFMPDYGPYADNSGNWLPAFGNVAGKYFLAQSSWPYNVNNKQITYQMFTAHSDAFLRLYTEVPQTLTVTHEEVSLAGNTNFNITATEGAMIALTLDGEILAVADATGVQQTIIIPATLIPTNEINVVCTKQNYLRYESVVTVVPADGPYVIGNNWVVNDDNHDEILQYGESATIDMTAKNVGIETASNVSMTISSESEHVTIIQNTANFGNIAADATATVNDAFEVLISEDVPNNTTILFDISSTDGNDVWASAMTIKVYRPILAYDDFSWQGSFEAGETLSFAIAFENKGGAPVNDVVGVLSSANQYVTIDVAEQAYGNILPNETGIAIFNVTLSDETPQSGLIEFNISVSGDEGMITADGSFGIENKCTIYFDMWDSSGDGWDSNGRISIRQNNIEIASVKLQSGSFGQTELSLPTGELDFVWIYGNNYDYENSFKIYNHDHELIYQTSGTPTAGSFLVYDNSCGQSGIICESPINLLAENEENIVTLSWESDGVNFIVKRDGVQIGSTTETQFIDNAAPFGLLEYSVTAICISGAVSDESKVNVEIAALYPPVKELHAEITDNNVYISWIEPTTKDFEISSFKIYRNDVEIANVFDAYYSDNNLLNGNYIYCVEVIYDDGETSDKICLDEIIIDICEIPANLNVNINVNNASLMWSETINPSQSYNVYRNNEIISNTTDTHFYDNDLNNGEYEYCIEAIYSNCTSERICFDLINIAVCHQPINLTHIAENNSVVLEWEKSPFVSSANYSVYRNDELLAENISETNYTDVNPVKGNSVYGVQANYNLECETSDPATLQVNYVGINNYDSNVKIYPNPAQNILNIEAKDMSKITIYNNSGQIVLKLDVNGDKTNVDVSKLNSGIYVLDIVDTNNSSIKTKVVITK
ncbi:C25 family cysteine peptidase [Odoribacter sp. OttesenSCG-928-L07]|nr:C25 family cysteine peptidase [Odoribacter sp. OttesenSCG-928-L07]